MKRTFEAREECDVCHGKGKFMCTPKVIDSNGKEKPSSGSFEMSCLKCELADAQRKRVAVQQKGLYAYMWSVRGGEYDPATPLPAISDDTVLELGVSLDPVKEAHLLREQSHRNTHLSFVRLKNTCPPKVQLCGEPEFVVTVGLGTNCGFYYTSSIYWSRYEKPAGDSLDERAAAMRKDLWEVLCNFSGDEFVEKANFLRQKLGFLAVQANSHSLFADLKPDTQVFLKLDPDSLQGPDDQYWVEGISGDSEDDSEDSDDDSDDE